MDNIKFEDFIGKMQRLIDEARKQNAFHEFIESKDKNKPKGCIVKEDFNEGNGYYKVNLAYLNKEQVEEIENLIEKWNPTDEDIKACIGMCLTDVNEQRFKDYGTNLRDCLAWLEKQGEQKQDPCNNCKDVRLNCHNFPCIEKRAFKQGKSALEVIIDEKVDNQFCVKPVDKVESKFKIGDTMRTLQEASNGITSGLPVIVSIDNEYYHCNNELIAIKNQDNYEYPPMNRRQNTAWSEEDKKTLERVIRCIENHDYMNVDDIHWLKSLKDRVQPQPQPKKCSEWDSSKIQRICKYLNEAKKYYADITEVRECIDWLKSLRPQNRWKPSEGQMRALENIFAKHGAYNDDLLSLISDLKKLNG